MEFGEFKVFKGRSIEELEREVNDRKKEGWVLEGSIAISKWYNSHPHCEGTEILYLQPMIYKAEGKQHTLNLKKVYEIEELAKIEVAQYAKLKWYQKLW